MGWHDSGGDMHAWPRLKEYVDVAAPRYASWIGMVKLACRRKPTANIQGVSTGSSSRPLQKTTTNKDKQHTVFVGDRQTQCVSRAGVAAVNIVKE